MGELSKEKPVVVYCAYGFHVGCAPRSHCAMRASTPANDGWPFRLEGRRRAGQDERMRRPTMKNLFMS
jgi:hypothetical protein